ncbi:helix-hairpin-helix domain-containing protein [Pseudomonas cavernicola]|uniref:Helix-hairpin-helix domain-containing protein n=1 Tax=Pseudomonas cavernicola TaxID=2320866 RepID=A0A418XMW7_9PSED|nr:helix-hairpin-helix domain-containing protein [Pseudomonas cavernicola]RJG13822.1 helix-hairpin-helix domain-containing protein [Pseudomonas cavernicola]
MFKGQVSSLLFAVLTSLSVTAFAATPPKVDVAKPAVTQAAAVAEVGKVNLNTADAATLQRELIGIGEVKAKAIIDHRETNGPFASVDELLEVKGIGAATLEKNRDKLSLN